MMSTSMEDFDMYRLRDLREDRDLSQAEVARIIVTTQQQYSKIELGKADISGRQLIRLAQHYGVTTDYLLGLSGSPTAPNNR